MWSPGLGCGVMEDGREHRAPRTRTAHLAHVGAAGHWPLRSTHHSSSCFLPRASVWRFPRTLRQRRHLPEATSGTRNLPVSVVHGSGSPRGEGGRAGRGMAGLKCPFTPGVPLDFWVRLASSLTPAGILNSARMGAAAKPCFPRPQAPLALLLHWPPASPAPAPPASPESDAKSTWKTSVHLLSVSTGATAMSRPRAAHGVPASPGGQVSTQGCLGQHLRKGASVSLPDAATNTRQKGLFRFSLLVPHHNGGAMWWEQTGSKVLLFHVCCPDKHLTKSSTARKGFVWPTFPRDSPYGEVKAGTQSCQSHGILAGFFSPCSLPPVL